ncbi:hypothetical protein [Novosphingobium decolorationis]|uniref:Uncharacterized protein n=1 Tax=Novosphingobium decolorationis TaxID=2698673 RepID=A0ABX8E7G2_9SPHN|nr:hypothetical protein [Novosphingobium decolorationis]QVM84803.1 hypothetical protein HT578_14955 [Novosphingobium decolorationis]
MSAQQNFGTRPIADIWVSGDDLPCAAFTFSFMEASIGTRREFRMTLSGMTDRRVFGATDMSLERTKLALKSKQSAESAIISSVSSGGFQRD